jgi:hypothetical protein
MADNIQATPRNPLGGLFSDAYKWMRSPERTQQMQGMAQFLGTTGIPQTVERLSYGEPLTNISQANVPLLKPETADALMTVAPFAGDIARGTGRLAGSAINDAMVYGTGPLASVTPQPLRMVGTRFKGSGAVPTEVPGFGPAREIQDTGSSVNLDNLVTAMSNDKNAPKNLGDILNHPELYRDYPELAKYPVQGLGTMQAILDAVRGSGLKGMYADGNFYLPTMSQKAAEAKLGDIHSTLLHETQHAIQQLDKMPEGGMTEQFLSQGYAKARQKVDTLKNAAYKELESKIADKGLESNTIFDIMFDNASGKALIQNDKTIGPSAVFYQKILKADYKLQKKYDEAYNKYRSLGGEAQARAVQKRFENPEEYAKPVTKSYDVPIESLNYRDPMGFTIK